MNYSEAISEPVWRAAMSAYHKAIRKNPGSAWQEAIAAAIAAWPMSHIHEWQRGTLNGVDIILPVERGGEP